jgi:hypothetical protein
VAGHPERPAGPWWPAGRSALEGPDPPRHPTLGSLVVPLSVLGSPVNGRSRCCDGYGPGPGCWPMLLGRRRDQDGAPAAQRGRTTLASAPTQQLLAGEEHQDQPTVATSQLGMGGRCPAVRGRPALSWCAGCWPGDVMLEGVTPPVGCGRPLDLSGPTGAWAWRPGTGGSRPPHISVVGRARTGTVRPPPRLVGRCRPPAPARRRRACRAGGSSGGRACGPHSAPPGCRPGVP